MPKEEKQNQDDQTQDHLAAGETDFVPADRKIRKDEHLALKVFINLLMLIVLGVLGVLVWKRVIVGNAQVETPVAPIQFTEIVASTDEVNQSIGSPPAYADFTPGDKMLPGGIQRKLELQTIIPSRPRVEVITYTVQQGDTLFDIAYNFGIKPETVLWGNFEVLKDNPHLLTQGQTLNILPVNGTYYQWHAGDSLNGVASFFKVEPQNILDYPGNRFDLTALNSISAGLEEGDWLIIPGGWRPLKDWGPPAITRANPASASYYGEGSCGAVYEGAIGTGSFVLPTVTKSISGYGYSSIHPAIDFAGAEGNAVFAADSGVVVFAGWSNYGYGYLIVVDHGNGFQTAYAHLSAVAVACGQSVFRGGYIGAVGTTGNSTGPHLHFEIIYNGAKPNPLGYLP